MTDYIVQGESLSAVADKIREKTDSSTSLAFPEGFVDAIDGLIDPTVDVGSVTIPDVEITATPTINITSIGLIMAEVNGSGTVTPSVTPGYVSAVEDAEAVVTGYASSQLPAQAAQTITPTTADQTIPAGKFLTGAQTIKGDANLIPANIADGVTIFGVLGTHQGGGAQPQLYGPLISISGRTLTIVPNSNNGTFGDNFVLYDGANVVATVPKSTTTINLNDYFSTAGLHFLSVKMTGTNFEDSNASNSVSYALYSVSVSITDGTATYDNMISNHETAVITLEADEGYVLPVSVTVSGATSAYDSNAGTITLSNATGNVTVSVVCEEAPTDLNSLTWAEIKDISDRGQGANTFDVGDRKEITLNGTVGTLTLNNLTEYVYIIGFDHNSATEGTGISFGTFFTALENGVSIALCDSHYGSSSTDGSKWFNMNHSGNTNDGGWKGCDLRYDILGSVEAKNQQNATSIATSSPVANTLMTALPSELRAVMKPITKYSDNVGGNTNAPENVTTTVDYLPLPAEYEIFGSRTSANSAEQSHQTQYDYYNGMSSTKRKKYNHSNTSTAVIYRGRSVSVTSTGGFVVVNTYGSSSSLYAQTSYGLSPVFLV